MSVWVASGRLQQKLDVTQNVRKLGDGELDKCNKIRFAVLLRCYTAHGSLDSGLQRPKRAASNPLLYGVLPFGFCAHEVHGLLTRVFWVMRRIG